MLRSVITIATIVILLVLNTEKRTEDPDMTYITIRKFFKRPCAITIARSISQATWVLLEKIRWILEIITNR